MATLAVDAVSVGYNEGLIIDGLTDTASTAKVAIQKASLYFVWQL